MDEGGEALKTFFDRQQTLWREMNHLQSEVGKLVILISDTDSKLNLLFALLCSPLDRSIAEDILEDQQSLEKKIKLVNLLIEMQSGDDEKAIWAEAKKVLQESRTMRNLVAHQSAWYSEDDPSGIIKVFLGPHPVAPKNRKQATAKEITTITDRMIVARHQITEVTRLLGVRKGFWEQDFLRPQR